MKIQVAQPTFRPITIVLETPEEWLDFMDLINTAEWHGTSRAIQHARAFKNKVKEAYSDKDKKGP